MKISLNVANPYGRKMVYFGSQNYAGRNKQPEQPPINVDRMKNSSVLRDEILSDKIYNEILLDTYKVNPYEELSKKNFIYDFLQGNEEDSEDFLERFTY